jgi:hypothetical protein
MTWFKVDDSFYDHPKVFDAPDCAVALWVRAGAWSARNLTEGFVPSGMPARLCDDHDTAVKELVRRRLWSRSSGGYRFHDWSTFQPSKESVQGLRAKRAAAGKLGGQAKAANQNAGKPLASASPDAKQNAAPTRPVLKNEVQNHSSSPPATTATDDPRFDEFWTAYPRKVGKPAARKAWRAALKRGTDPGTVVTAAQAYRDDPNRKPEFTKHPGPWLNDERYNDPRPDPQANGGWWNN